MSPRCCLGFGSRDAPFMRVPVVPEEIAVQIAGVFVFNALQSFIRSFDMKVAPMSPIRSKAAAREGKLHD